MEKLRQDITAMHATVAARNSAGQIPSTDQLASFVLNITDSIDKTSQALPIRVKEICRNNFLAMGWNSRTKVVVKPALFTAANLEGCLATLKGELESWSPPVAPTEDELQNLSAACSRLWDLDGNRLVPGHDYVINVQRGKIFSEAGDVASEPLFTFVDEHVFHRPTYRAFSDLLDNYVASVGVAEVISAEERAENLRFLNLMMDTACMQYVQQYLFAHHKIPANDRESFIQILNQAWFETYGRVVANDSSGFEHVFLGEVRGNEVIGMHNWIQIYNEEKKGRLDYRGYIKPRRKPRGGSLPDASQQLISLQFSWNGGVKPVSSSFIGTSPEFEFALYTMCFFLGEESYIVAVGPYKVEVSCHKWTQRGKQFISTSFPAEAPIDENEAAATIQARVKGSQARSGSHSH